MKPLYLWAQLLVFALIVGATLFLILRPIKITRENSIVFTSTVYKIGQGSENSVILQLDNGEGIFFISHGLQKGLNLDTLRQKLINQKVTVSYLKSNVLSGLSPVASRKYITEVRLGAKVIYSEL